MKKQHQFQSGNLTCTDTLNNTFHTKTTRQHKKLNLLAAWELWKQDSQTQVTVPLLVASTVSEVAGLNTAVHLNSNLQFRQIYHFYIMWFHLLNVSNWLLGLNPVFKHWGRTLWCGWQSCCACVLVVPQLHLDPQVPDHLWALQWRCWQPAEVPPDWMPATAGQC